MFRSATYSRVSSVIGLSLVLAACATSPDPGDGGGGGGGGGGGPAPVIDSATSLSFANAANGLMQTTLHVVYSGQQLGTPDPFLLPDLAAGPPGVAGILGARGERIARSAMQCDPAVTGVDTLGLAIDSDGDDIPDDFTVDYGAGCTAVDSLGNTVTFSGGYRLQDTGNGVLDFAYTPTDLAAMVRDPVSGHFFRQRVTSVETSHFTTSHAAHEMDATREITAWEGGDTVHAVVRIVESSTFDMDPGSVFTRHAHLQQGTLHFTSVFTVHDLGAGKDSIRFVLSTPTPIHIAFSCASGLDAGQLLGLLEGDDRVGFRFDWAGCIIPAPELFGTTP